MATAKEDSFFEHSFRHNLEHGAQSRAQTPYMAQNKALLHTFYAEEGQLAYSFFFSFAISHTANIPNAAPQQSSKTSFMLFPLFEKI